MFEFLILDELDSKFQAQILNIPQPILRKLKVTNSRFDLDRGKLHILFGTDEGSRSMPRQVLVDTESKVIKYRSVLSGKYLAVGAPNQVKASVHGLAIVNRS